MPVHFKTTVHTVKRTSPDTCPSPSAPDESACAATPQSSSSSTKGVITITPIPPANIIAVIDLSSCESESDDEEIPESFIRYCEEKWAKEKAIREAEEMRRQLTCKICYDNPINITMVPCGHFATCKKCAVSLKECPICREAINQKVKTFM